MPIALEELISRKNFSCSVFLFYGINSGPYCYQECPKLVPKRADTHSSKTFQTQLHHRAVCLVYVHAFWRYARIQMHDATSIKLPLVRDVLKQGKSPPHPFENLQTTEKISNKHMCF